MVASSTGSRSWSSLRTTVVGELLADAIAGLGPAPLRIVDAGGGTGGFAVPLAVAGHQVTVVDPSPDAMAALRRRAAEHGVSGSVVAIQGDLAGLLDVVAFGQADVVLCHNVLAVVDDPAAALRTVHGALGRGGLVSVVTAGRGGAVLGRALAGRFRDAIAALDHDPSAGGAAAAFTPAALHALLTGAGFTIENTHGIRVFSDVAPGGLLDADPDATAALLDLERAVATRPEFLAVAGQLHVLARSAGPAAPAGPGVTSA